MEARVDDRELCLEHAARGEERKHDRVVRDDGDDGVPLDAPALQVRRERQASRVEPLVGRLLARAQIDEGGRATRDARARPQHFEERWKGRRFHDEGANDRRGEIVASRAA